MVESKLQRIATCHTILTVKGLMSKIHKAVIIKIHKAVIKMSAWHSITNRFAVVERIPKSNVF